MDSGSSYRANGLGQIDTRVAPHALYLALDADDDRRRRLYRELFRPQLDDDATTNIREALQLGMPVGNERFAETICARVGVRWNSGKRGRPAHEGSDRPTPITGQTDFGF